MIDSFEDTFTEEVWEGKSKTLWPLNEESPRNDHWKRRLRLLRLQFEHEMKELRILSRENQERRHEIESLQDHLFSGTSIQESRKSVELADITVQQGRNIKVRSEDEFELCSTNSVYIAFNYRQLVLHAVDLCNFWYVMWSPILLVINPNIYATIVYGMTNMPTEPHYWMFGVTLATVCVPFFSLVGFLSTDLGYRIWMAKTKALWRWMRPKPSLKITNESEFQPNPVNRTLSTDEGMQKRLGQGQGQAQTQTHNRPVSSSRPSHPNIQKLVEAIGEGNQGGVSRMGTVVSSDEVRDEEASAGVAEKEMGAGAYQG